jgi:hypothetical protein
VRVLPPPVRTLSPSELAARLEVERTGEAAASSAARAAPSTTTRRCLRCSVSAARPAPRWPGEEHLKATVRLEILHSDAPNRVLKVPVKL